MDVIAQTGAPANRETEHASSTQHDHVSRGTRRRLCPTTSSACLSHVRWGRTLLPFTSSSCAAERARGGPEARRRSRSAQRCDDEGRAAVTRRHRRAGVRTRIGSHRRHGAMSTARSTHGLLGYTPPPTTKFQLLPLVSRETCQRPQPCSIPAHTGLSVMTGEGPGAN